MDAKDTSARSRGVGGGAALEGREKRNGLQRAPGAAVPTAPSPPPSGRGPTSSGHSSGAVRGKPRPQAATEKGRPAPPSAPHDGAGPQRG